MKRLITITVLALGWAAQGAGVHTLNNGIVLGLEFASPSVVAGERLIGTMTVSNASPGMAHISASKDSGNRWLDTPIGNFVVTDEFGNVLPKTIPYRSLLEIGSSGAGFPPGASARYSGDVVYGYSLTNPGTYFVKAVASVPLTNDAGSFASFTAETPTLEITVTPRPADMPPAPSLYPELEGSPAKLAALKAEEELLRRDEAAIQRRAIQAMFHPRGAAPRAAEAHASVAEAKARVQGPPVEATPSASERRNVVYGLVVVLVVAVLGIFIWLTRRIAHDKKANRGT